MEDITSDATRLSMRLVGAYLAKLPCTVRAVGYQPSIFRAPETQGQKADPEVSLEMTVEFTYCSLLVNSNCSQF